MSSFLNKPASPKDLTELDLSAGSAPVRQQDLLVPARYYFNLTDGDTMIRDEEGIEASSIQVAALSAIEAIEEVRAQDGSTSDEVQGWRVEIVDDSGRAVQPIPLDARSAH